MSVSAPSMGHLPTWATDRCHDCGEMFLTQFGSVWSSRQPDRVTHGGLKRCQAQADYLATNPDALVVTATLAHQGVVEAAQILGRFMAETEDENWTDEVAQAVLGAQNALERALNAHKLIDEPSRDPEDYNAAYLWALLRPLLLERPDGEAGA